MEVTANCVGAERSTINRARPAVVVTRAATALGAAGADGWSSAIAGATSNSATVTTAPKRRRSALNKDDTLPKSSETALGDHRRFGIMRSHRAFCGLAEGGETTKPERSQNRNFAASAEKAELSRHDDGGDVDCQFLVANR